MIVSKENKEGVSKEGRAGGMKGVRMGGKKEDRNNIYDYILYVIH